MSTVAARRLAKLEGSLHPQAAVLAWLAEAQQFPSTEAVARSIADQPVEAAPLSVIGARVLAFVRETMKGQPRAEIDQIARRRQGDAVFLFCLVLILNDHAFEVARFNGLWAAAVAFWMRALVGRSRDERTSDEDERERAGAWRSWRSAVDQLVMDVRVEAEARAKLEQRYFAGHQVLLSDAAAAWAGHVDVVERLERLAEIIVPASPAKPTRRQPTGGASAAQIDELTDRLADDARVKAYEILGERERAVTIMEHRLRS